MKTVSTAFKNTSLGSEATTLCTCWEIIRVDGVVFRFTDLDIALTVNGEIYSPAIGYNRTAISNSANMSVDNMDVEGILDDESITIEDMRGGKFNGASIRVFLVDWTALGNGIMRMRRGWLGEITVTPNGRFKTELRGMNQALTQNVVETTTPQCRADLGDARCKVDIDSDDWARNGEVTAVTSRREFTVLITNPDSRASATSWYQDGVLTWLTGGNEGRKIEVKQWNGADTLSLFLSMPYAIAVGDTFRVRPGCDKLRTTCKNKFNNIVNMRAEPFTPGKDTLMSYPDAN